MAPADATFELSDWRATKLPKLSQLDSLLRCLICKDFLRAPVITSCNHTFCSQCIRQHLMSVSRCPLCKAEQFESNLKRNILLEEVVACFQSTRPDLIRLATIDNDTTSETDTPQGTPQRAKTPNAADAEIIEVSDDPESDSRTESSNSRTEATTRTTPPPGSVQCPICGNSMSADYLQRKHIDECLSGKRKLPVVAAVAKRKREGISLYFQSRKKSKEVDHEHFYFAQADKHHHETKRMAKLDYASVSTPKLKEKLAALKLLVLGTRPQLELRYNQFYLLFNSNLDSSRPVSDLELRQKLNQWEKSHLAFSAPVSVNSIFGDALSHKNITDKDFPAKAWQEKFKDEFRDLVRAARKSRKKGALGTPNQDAAKSAVSEEVPSELPRELSSSVLAEPSTSRKTGDSRPAESAGASHASLGDTSDPPHSGTDTPLEIRQPQPDIAADETFDFTASTLFMPMQQ